MQHHPDPDVNRAMINLMDALCSWERSTGRESLLVLIPVESDEEHVVMAHSGKPTPLEHLDDETIGELVERALKAHRNPNVHYFADVSA